MEKKSRFFYKVWPDRSRMDIIFKEASDVIIVQNVIENSIYEKKMYEEEKIFRLKKLNPDILKLLNERGFQEDIKPYREQNE
ncbi:MAG: hypothetical protein OXB86_02940 [Bdellovibrionales bacterium]|nr:hypothetical protein [Bdellovibrionales bacterium]